MKRIFAVSMFVFLAVQIGFGQLNDEEIRDLRRQIKLSDRDSVRINERGGLSDDSALKVYLAIDRRGDEKKYFEKWVREWNEKNGDRYGRLEQVNDISQADIVLAQFIKTGIKNVGEVGVSVRSIDLPGQANQSKVRVKNDLGYASLKLPVYSYLLKRENDIWTILYASVETSITGEQLFNPEKDLWNAYSKKRKDQ